MIQGVPKRSTVMPKSSDQNVFCRGMVILPPLESSLKMRSVSAGSLAVMETLRPWGAWIILRGSVAAHQDLITDDQTDVNNSVVHFRGEMRGHGGASVGHDSFDLAAENFFVGFEGFVALAVETEIRSDFHDGLLFLGEARIAGCFLLTPVGAFGLAMVTKY